MPKYQTYFTTKRRALPHPPPPNFHTSFEVQSVLLGPRKLFYLQLELFYLQLSFFAYSLLRCLLDILSLQAKKLQLQANKLKL